MRIIAGKCKGMNLAAPRGKRTRPMTDAVRESLFSTLGSRFGEPGSLPQLCVMDIFAGTGALGLEALSRGVNLCCFVEQSRPALNCLKQNIEKTNMKGQCWIITGDAFTSDLPQAPNGVGWQLVFLDPPYPITQQETPAKSITQLLKKLSISELLADDALVILRHPADVDYRKRVDHLRPCNSRIYGTTRFTWFIYERSLS